TQSGAFPIFEGVDVSWYRNCKYAVDAFIIDCEEDFFGYYDYNTERGLVQYANHFVVPGKKRFTWGTSEDGRFWTPILSDKGMPYIELQSGRFRTQGIVEFIEPQFSEEWSERWYPIAKIGGISFANGDAAIYVDLRGETSETFVGIYATRDIPGSRIRFRDGDGVTEEVFDLSPMRPFTKSYASKGKRVEVEVLDKDGGEVVKWDCGDYRTKLDESVFMVPKEIDPKEEVGPEGIEGLWVDAMLEDKRGERLIAELKYKRLLELDWNLTSGICALAVLYFRQGRYGEAIELLERAVKVRPDNEDAQYFLGLCHLKTGRFCDSEMALWKARRSRKYFAPASYLLSLIKIRNKEYGEAEKIVAEGLDGKGGDLKGLFIRSVALRRSGRSKEALEVVEYALGISPLHYQMLCERVFCSKGRNEFYGAEVELKRVVLTDGQKVLAVAMGYMDAGLFDEAEEILRRGIEA
ncbi:DUF5107 domain-containing protein, partial [bacterium]